ncbi:UNVERIFIED_CONTAM: hypothetical protein PYX00_010028 [Menopon gallinae]|uniref:Osteopetrosis-associated transmembrane protein 1 n=1 Tax=Menopon gallinae TaxID=328185 RepID=A0AAW2HDX4_9NEOP
MDCTHFIKIIVLLLFQNNFIGGLGIKTDVDDADVCTFLLQNFASASAEFMFCSISNARPIQMCTLCVDSYSGVVEGHSNIFRVEESENKTCRDELINLDRLAIIEAGYSYIRDLWLKANCKNCFLPNPNTTTPFQLSNETKEFQRLHLELKKCLDANYNESTREYNREVCKICSSKYSDMNTFYGNLKKDLNDLLCMDIVDSMNVTQNLWSDRLHCGETIMFLEWQLITYTTVVLIIPIVFYLCAWRFTKTKPSDVSHQKRLSERIREKWRSRTGSMASQIRFH